MACSGEARSVKASLDGVEFRFVGPRTPGGFCVFQEVRELKSYGRSKRANL